jgi:hypothetical protein
MMHGQYNIKFYVSILFCVVVNTSYTSYKNHIFGIDIMKSKLYVLTT